MLIFKYFVKSIDHVNYKRACINRVRWFASLHLISIQTLSGFLRLAQEFSDIYGTIMKNDVLA